MEPLSLPRPACGAGPRRWHAPTATRSQRPPPRGRCYRHGKGAPRPHATRCTPLCFLQRGNEKTQQPGGLVRAPPDTLKQGSPHGLKKQRRSVLSVSWVPMKCIGGLGSTSRLPTAGQWEQQGPSMQELSQGGSAAAWVGACRRAGGERRVRGACFCAQTHFVFGSVLLFLAGAPRPARPSMARRRAAADASGPPDARRRRPARPHLKHRLRRVFLYSGRYGCTSRCSTVGAPVASRCSAS